MSDLEQSALDHLVDEVFDGRAAVEAAVAPAGAPLEASDSDGDVASLTFADGEGPADSEPACTATVAASELEQLRSERDGFLADSQRLAADFANFRKQSEKRVTDAAAAQSASLVRDLLPVLDACDSALVQDPDSAAGPIRSALIGELEKNGLALLAPEFNDAFDPADVIVFSGR